MESEQNEKTSLDAGKAFDLIAYGKEYKQNPVNKGTIFIEYYSIIFISGGTCSFEINQKKYSLKENNGLLLGKNELVSFVNSNADCRFLVVGGSETEKNLSQCGLSEKQRTFQADADSYCSCFDEIEKADRLSYSGQFLKKSLLYKLFSIISASTNPNFESEIDASCGNLYVDKAAEFLRNNLKLSASMSELSNYLGLNRSYITSLFKRYLHMSPHNYLMKLRIEKSCRLLYLTDLSISETAFSCGYNDSLAFSKAFHNAMDCSPSQYRIAMRKKKMPVIQPLQANSQR